MEKCGLNLTYYCGRDFYSDGDIENVILEIVESGEDYDHAIANNFQWPVVYHLSKQREMIVQPMQLKKDDRVLEIGSGCGAVTGALAKRAGWVDCVELSKKRSQINLARHQEYGNIHIYG